MILIPKICIGGHAHYDHIRNAKLDFIRSSGVEAHPLIYLYEIQVRLNGCYRRQTGMYRLQSPLFREFVMTSLTGQLQTS